MAKLTIDSSPFAIEGCDVSSVIVCSCSYHFPLFFVEGVTVHFLLLRRSFDCLSSFFLNETNKEQIKQKRKPIPRGGTSVPDLDYSICESGCHAGMGILSREGNEKRFPLFQVSFSSRKGPIA